MGLIGGDAEPVREEERGLLCALSSLSAGVCWVSGGDFLVGVGVVEGGLRLSSEMSLLLLLCLLSALGSRVVLAAPAAASL